MADERAGAKVLVATHWQETSMPNDMPGAARYVRLNTAVPTAGVGLNPTWRGNAMNPLTVVSILPGASFDARGTGLFPLSQPGPFPRGTRISGQRGSLDLWIVVGLDGTARTACYLTDNPNQPTTYLGVRLDTSNRPFLEIYRPLTPFSFAAGTFTASGAITNAEDVTIDGKVYTIQSTLTNVDGNVKQGANEVETLANLAAAITLSGGAGARYAAAMTVHPTVRAESVASVLTATAKAPGTGGNAITTTDNCLNATWDLGGTLAGGAGSVVLVAQTDPAQAPAAPNYEAGKRLHLRLTWNTEDPVVGTRYASFSVNGEAIPTSHWTTNPIAAWPFWQMSHLVLGAALLYEGDADFNGTVEACQLSEVVTP